MLLNKKINVNNLSLSLLKVRGSLYVYIYNKNYYCLLKVKKTIKINVRMVNVINIFFDIPQNTSIIRNIYGFLDQLSKCDFTKIKFTGKGYKIRKTSQNSISLLFNRSHMTVLWWNNIIVKKLKKYKVYIRFLKANKSIVKNILNVRYINIFTKKGLRLSRQVVFKKKGKK